MADGRKWKEVASYQISYEVSDDGSVRVNLGGVKSIIPAIKKIEKSRILKPRPHKSGYVYAVVSVAGERYDLKVHRMVGVAFIQNKKNKPIVNHKDGRRNNNKKKNLEWVTPSENQIHSYQVLGRKPSNQKTRPVIAFNKTEEIYYASVQAAGRAHDPAQVCRCLSGKRKTHHGFSWKYATQGDKK